MLGQMLRILHFPTENYKDRRTRTSTSMHIQSALLVTSTTVASATFIVPTVYFFRRTHNATFSSKKQWLRSPFTGYSDTAWFVTSSGFVDTFSRGEVDSNSYGRKDRRAQATTTVRGACGQVVVSTAITTSEIPTDKLRRTRTTPITLGLSTRLVTSPSEASTVSRIPTVFFRRAHMLIILHGM